MKLMLAEPKFLKDSISIISDLVNEVIFKIDKDKLELIAMDPANVSLVVFKLLSSAFIEYNVSNEEELSINLDNLNQILKRAKPSDTLTIELDKEKNRLKIQLKGESTRTFNLSLIDIEKREQKIPDLKFPLTIEIPSNILDSSIDDMSIIADSLSLIAEKDKFAVQAASKLSDAKVEINQDDETKINLTSKDKVTAKYSIEYLKKIVKGSKLADNVILQFDEEYPLKAQYKVMDKLDLTFILAPRVSSD